MKKIILFALTILCLFLVGCGHKHEYYNGICNCGETNIHMHDFKDGDCVCGKSSEGFKATVNGFTVEGSSVKKYVGTSTDVEIPERYFCNNEYVLITHLDKFIFSTGVFGIDLFIPITITKIDSQALVGAGNVSYITVSNYNKSFISINGDLYTRDKATLVRFVSNKMLDEYKVIDSVTTIGDFAFAYAMVSKLVIGDAVETIGKSAFYGSFISNVEISEANTNFKSLNNVIYSKDETTLIYYLSLNTNQEFVIPSTVKVVKEGAFYNPTLLSKIIIPETVLTVEENAFVLVSGQVNCKASSKPNSWSDKWIDDATNVVWSYTE